MNDDIKTGYWLGGRDEMLYQIMLVRMYGVQETLKLMLDKLDKTYGEKDNPHVKWMHENIDNIS